MKYTYEALQYNQRDSNGAPEFVLFHAPAIDIKKWADVDRLATNNPTGAQRPLRELKVNRVARFFSQDPRNTVPTAVVLAIDRANAKFHGVRDKRGKGKHGELTITVRGSQKPALIIDGQHRVEGALKFSGDTHLSIIAFLGGDDAERAFQFVVINNTATKVSKDHIKALNLQYDQDKLNKRLVASAGVSLGLSEGRFDDLQVIDTEEPFEGQLKWPTNSNGFIAPNAIEAALAETQDRAALLGIQDLERDVFLAIWARIKHLRPSEWRKHSASDPCHLLQKVSIYALTVYILDSLEAVQRMAETPLDFTKEATLHSFVDKMVERIPAEFWTTPWKVTELDTSSGRQTLSDALRTIDANVRYGHQWYENVSLIDPSLLNNQVTKKPARKRAAKKKK